MKTLIVVIGPNAALKSTLSKRIGKDMKIPCFNKDDIKEILADRIGYSNREENLKLSFTTFHLMVHAMKRVFEVMDAVILESNFRKFEYEQLEAFAREKDVRLVTLYLKAEAEPLYERFKKRLDSRHHAHRSVGLPSYREFRDHVVDYEKRAYAEPLIEVDTTDPDLLDFARLIERIRAVID
ncbi:MAG: AAA family ATPase [Acholeplasmataceae bacterium]